MKASPCHVVVGFDFSHSANVALRRAIALAARAPFHALHFVCVIDPHTSIPAIDAPDGVDYRYAERVQQALTAVVECELIDADVTRRIHFYIHARIGKPATEILAVAREIGAELIIVGSKGITGIERILVGSVAERIVRDAHCTVEVARPNTYEHVDLLTMIRGRAGSHVRRTASLLVRGPSRRGCVPTTGPCT